MLLVCFICKLSKFFFLSADHKAFFDSFKREIVIEFNKTGESARGKQAQRRGYKSLTFHEENMFFLSYEAGSKKLVISKLVVIASKKSSITLYKLAHMYVYLVHYSLSYAPHPQNMMLPTDCNLEHAFLF